MASEASGGTDWIRRAQDLILPVAIIASVLVILVPLPPALMDVLLAGNITIAVIVLLTTIYVRTPLEFSIFPDAAVGDDAGAPGAQRSHHAIDPDRRRHRRRITPPAA